MRYLFIVGAALMLVPTPVDARTWTSGQQKLEAEFLEVIGDKVALRKPDGKTIRIAIRSLSAADQEYVLKRSGRWRPPRKPAVNGASVEGGEKAIRRGLAKNIRLNFKATPLTEVVDQLREKAGVEIMLDRPALAKAGIQVETPVSLIRRKSQLRDVLNDILQPVELIWDVQNEVILITTEGNQLYVPVVYQTATGTDLPQLQAEIMKTVEPDSWDKDGGLGAIVGLRDAIMVNQTWNVQFEIAKNFEKSVRPIPPGALTGPTINLDAKISLTFDEKPFSEILDHFRKNRTLIIDLDKAALAAVGVNLATPVTIRVERVSLRAALNIVLRSVEPTVTWSISKRGIVITTRLAAAQNLIQKTYHVKDLASVVNGDQLVEAITKALEPHTWDETKGSTSVEAGPGQLTVSQTVHGHLLVYRLIQNLRKVKR